MIMFLFSKLVKDIARCGGEIDGFILHFIVEKVMEKLFIVSRKEKRLIFN